MIPYVHATIIKSRFENKKWDKHEKDHLYNYCKQMIPYNIRKYACKLIRKQKLKNLDINDNKL